MKRAAKGGDILIKTASKFCSTERGWFLSNAAQRPLRQIRRREGPAYRIPERTPQGEARGDHPRAQAQCRTKSDQRRRHVSDWRAVGNVPANCSGVADLAGADTPNKFAKVRINLAKHINGVSVTGASANGDAIVTRLYVFQIVD